MKSINVKVFNQEGNESLSPVEGTLLIDSSYRVINVEKMLQATEKAIITLIEKIECDSFEWLSSRVKSVLSGELGEDSFYIDQRFYVIESK